METSDWVNAAISILAVSIAGYSLWISRNNAQRQKEEDFFGRRHELLLKVIEAKIRSSETAVLDSEIRTLHNQLSELSDGYEVKIESPEPDLEKSEEILTVLEDRIKKWTLRHQHNF